MQLIPVVAVEVPLGGEQQAQHVVAVEEAALRLVERLQLGQGQVAAGAVQVLGLGDHVARLRAKLRLDVRRDGQTRGELAGLLVRAEKSRRECAPLRERAQLGPTPRVAVVGPQCGGMLEAAQRLGQLGPQADRARVLGGDEREVAVDAAAEVQRLAQVDPRVAGLVVHVAGDGRDRRDLKGSEVGDGAALAHGPRREGGEAIEVADHGVASALLRGRAGGADVMLDLGAEDVVGLLAEILAGQDGGVARVDLAKLAAAGPPDQHVDDVAGAGEQVFAGAGLTREPEGDLEVMAQQDTLTQLLILRAGQEAGGDHEHPEAVRHEQVEAAAHEICVGGALLVVGVLVLEPVLAALAVRRVGEDQAERALVARRVLTHPPLERHREQLDIRPHRPEHPGADVGQLHRGPAGLLVARVGDQAAWRAHRADEAADADARLERPHDAVEAGEVSE